MDINNYFYNKDRDDIYHPFSDYNDDKCFPPENSLTKQLILLRLIWDDVLCLNEIYRGQEDFHKRKAILKYMVMDMCSLYDKFQEFRDLVIHDRSIKCEQQKEILERFDLFLPKLNNFSKGAPAIPAGKYRNVRNRLSAHRDRNVSLVEVKNIWNNLNPQDIENITEEIRHFFDYLKGLGFYQWAKFNRDSTIEIINNSPFIEKKSGENNQEIKFLWTLRIKK